MALFGRMQPRVAMQVDPLMVEGGSAPQAKVNGGPSQGVTFQRGGIFGRLRKNGPRILNIAGATLRQIDDPEGAALDALAAEQERQRAEQFAMSRLKQQDQRQADQQAYERGQDERMWGYRDRQAAQDQSQFEQAQQTTRRGQDMDYGLGVAGLSLRQQMQPQWTPRGPDAALSTAVSNGGLQASEGLSLLDQFEQANQTQATGMGSDIVGFFDPRMASMRQTSSLLQTMIAPQGQGQVSNYERELFRQGAPEVGLTGTQNQERIRNLRRLFQLRQARSEFYDQYGQTYQTLRGAEAAFQRSPEFQRLTGGQRQQGGGQQPRIIDLEPNP